MTEHRLESLERRWTLHLIHHSHTDVGYTDRQELVARRHVDFLRDALDLSERARDAPATADDGWRPFAWTCETFWAVERFLERATPRDRERLAEALRRGEVELSATYANLTELLDGEPLAETVRRAGAYGATIGVRVRSAMTADVNGHPWALADASLDAGVEHLLACVHALHGVYPLGRVQVPFWWEAPSGRRLLVWNGDHYHLGNVLGLAPGARLRSVALGDDGGGGPGPGGPADDLAFAEERVGRYLAGLEAEGHPWTDLAIGVSGLPTDNGPPSAAIGELARRWNARHGDRVLLRPTTLTPFFERLRRSAAGGGPEIPIHRGAWPDWWSDGVASTPRATRLFRDAQRILRAARALDRGGVLGAERLRTVHDALVGYAEHTWGHFASVATPWALDVQALLARKEAIAADAHRLAADALDDVLAVHGAAPLRPGRPLRVALHNPHPVDVEQDVILPLEPFESRMLAAPVCVVDEATDEALPHQVAARTRPGELHAVVSLPAGGRRLLAIRRAPPAPPLGSGRPRPLDGVSDLQGAPAPLVRVGEGGLATPTVAIAWRDGGIVSWRDAGTDVELLRPDRRHDAFALVRELTPMRPDDALGVRARMGRNRKGADVERIAARVHGVRWSETGPAFARVALGLALEGVRDAELVLTASAVAPRVEAALRLHADGGWAPENLYLSLPFGTPEGETWLETAGVWWRHGVDQLPGTLVDFACVGDGVGFLGDEASVAVAPLDSPLVQLGPLEHGPRRLHGAAGPAPSTPAYAWLATNVWETNFAASFAGFQEFRFVVGWGRGRWTTEELAVRCRALAVPPVRLRLGPEGAGEGGAA